MSRAPVDPISIDVGHLVQKTVASLYAHLVTRQTGRAVRLAIETRLAGAGERTLSVIDLSEVTILDFSCADEVVAKLIQRYAPEPDAGTPEAFFVFCGVHEPKRDPIEVVLLRQNLAAVVETGAGTFELLGACSPEEAEAWQALEAEGHAHPDPRSGDHDRLRALAERRLAFWNPSSSRYHSLSALARPLLSVAPRTPPLEESP